MTYDEERRRRGERFGYEQVDWVRAPHMRGLSLEAKRDLEHGTIYDRSLRERGNFDLPEDRDYRGRRMDDWRREGARSVYRPASRRYRQVAHEDEGRGYYRGEDWDLWGEPATGWSSRRSQDWEGQNFNGEEKIRPADLSHMDFGEGARDLVRPPRRQDRPSPAKMEGGEGRATPGPYQGIGPRGYQRSDASLGEVLCERLARHGQVDARDIEVEIKAGEVTLRGTVPDRRSKYLAEEIAASVSGVLGVHNQLRLDKKER